MLSVFLAFLSVAVSVPPPTPSASALDARAAVYELRVYYPAPGKLEALNARFRNHTTKLFEKHGMGNVAYWNEQPTKDAPEGRLVYVLAHRSRDAAGASWKAFGADPEWRSVHARSESAGTLVAKIDSLFMTMADYSPPIRLKGDPKTRP